MIEPSSDEWDDIEGNGPGKIKWNICYDPKSIYLICKVWSHHLTLLRQSMQEMRNMESE